MLKRTYTVYCCPMDKNSLLMQDVENSGLIRFYSDIKRKCCDCIEKCRKGAVKKKITIEIK